MDAADSPTGSTLDRLRTIAGEARYATVRGERVDLIRPTADALVEFHHWITMEAQKADALPEGPDKAAAMAAMIAEAVARTVATCTGLTQEEASDLVVVLGQHHELVQRSVGLTGTHRVLGEFVGLVRDADDAEEDDRPI